MKIKTTLEPRTDGTLIFQHLLILEKDDRIKLNECFDFVQQLYDMVIRRKSIIPTTETKLIRFLNKIEAINKQYTVILDETEK